MLIARHSGSDPQVRVHVWETAGLGVAPYRFVGVTKNWFTACPGDPGKPGGSCDYCCNGIAYEFRFTSADGRSFKVGSDCFYKSNSDRSLKRVVDAAVAKHEREMREARNERKAVRLAVEHADLLTELDSWTTPGCVDFRSDFARSVARQIRKGKAPTSRQLAVIARLRSEAA